MLVYADWQSAAGADRCLWTFCQMRIVLTLTLFMPVYAILTVRIADSLTADRRAPVTHRRALFMSHVERFDSRPPSAVYVVRLCVARQAKSRSSYIEGGL